MFPTWLWTGRTEQGWRYALSSSIEHYSWRKPRVLSYGDALSAMIITRTITAPEVGIQPHAFRKGNCIIYYVWSLLAAILIILPTVAYAVVQCPTPDRSFKAFLQRFEEDIEFQRSRLVLPLVSRSGEYTMTNTLVELWDIEKIKKLSYPLILTRQGRKTEKVAEDVVLFTKRYVEVFHDGPPESDMYRMLYKFRNIEGCWFLEEVHDKSQ
jgi:hypothetical protein